MQIEKEIGDKIRHIANKYKGKLSFPVMSGVVVAGSFDADTMTISVIRSVDDENGQGVPGININVVLNNTGGIYVVPADGADCVICEVDGPDKWELLKASAYTKVIIQASSLVQFNDGSLGGLVEIEKLKDNLKAIHDYIFNILQPAVHTGIAGVSGGYGASGATAFNGAIAGQDITFEEMENTKIKHG